MKIVKTAAVAVALTVFGASSALAAEGMKCCCEKMAAMMECCDKDMPMDKDGMKPGENKGEADHGAKAPPAAETPDDPHKH